MEITIFASKKTFEKEGAVKTFYMYSAKLKNSKTGDEEYFKVKFNEDCDPPKPSECPVNVIIEKGDCSISHKSRTFTDKETGEPREIIDSILWVKNWKRSDNPFIDHSTDDYFMEG